MNVLDLDSKQYTSPPRMNRMNQYFFMNEIQFENVIFRWYYMPSIEVIVVLVVVAVLS